MCGSVDRYLAGFGVVQAFVLLSGLVACSSESAHAGAGELTAGTTPPTFRAPSPDPTPGTSSGGTPAETSTPSVPTPRQTATSAAAPSSAGPTPLPSGPDGLPNPNPGATGAAPALGVVPDGGKGGTSGAAGDLPAASGGAAGYLAEPAEPAPAPEPWVDEMGCPSALLGWAAVPGEGVQTTTGGGEATPVRPTSASELTAYASDPMPRVIEIEGRFDVSRLDIASNKTLVGIGPEATIRGGLFIRGSLQSPVSNVIVRNLNIDGGGTGGEDAVQVQFAHHVWFDHCDIWDGPDGNLDMTHAVNWSTISWTIFRYTAAYRRPAGESGDHRFSNLIGHDDDNAVEDRGRLKVTLHHNWWGEGVIERMPRVRFGEVHVFNNYYSSAASNYCVGAGAEAHLLLENNYFDGVEDPHRYINAGDANTAHVTASGNEYEGASGERVTGGGGEAFTTPSYSVELDTALDVKELVQRCAGPR